MSLENSNDTIGNRTRDTPVCSVVPQPLRHRAPVAYSTVNLLCVTTFFHYISTSQYLFQQLRYNKKSVVLYICDIPPACFALRCPSSASWSMFLRNVGINPYSCTESKARNYYLPTEIAAYPDMREGCRL
jgi:hypothetical protein